MMACEYADPKQHGVVMVDCETLQQEEVLSAETLTEMMLDEFNRDERMPDVACARLAASQVANIKWSPNGSELVLRFNFLPGQYMKSLFVFKQDV
jgi:hypothetical protein